MSDRALKSSLPHTVDALTRVLLLGSLPGDRSLAAREYYAHPSNGFWWLIGEVLGESNLKAMDYHDRLTLLRAHGIGLWDVIASARRHGSLDAAIRDVTLRNLVEFADQLPQLRAIGFNGRTASQHGRRQLLGKGDRWSLIDLPSSSAAYASMPRAAKLTIWREIERYLD
jgi:double-stranded uracil-DNA glycosylase